MTHITITQACYEDGAEILTLQKLAFECQARLYQCWTLPPLTQTLGQWQSEFPGRLVLKALAGTVIAGSVRALPDGRQAHIERLIVHPDYRRHGLATRLMTELEARLPQIDRFELFTGQRSAGAIALYQKLGYRIFTQKPAPDGVHLVFMEKLRHPPQLNLSSEQPNRE